jgi:hypothetical protein
MLYYSLSAISFFLVFVRLVYTWFRDFDNSQKFICDMADTHLPYLYTSIQRIADKLDVELPATPSIKFTNKEPRD